MDGPTIWLAALDAGADDADESSVAREYEVAANKAKALLVEAKKSYLEIVDGFQDTTASSKRAADKVETSLRDARDLLDDLEATLLAAQKKLDRPTGMVSLDERDALIAQIASTEIEMRTVQAQVSAREVRGAARRSNHPRCHASGCDSARLRLPSLMINCDLLCTWQADLRRARSALKDDEKELIRVERIARKKVAEVCQPQMLLALAWLRRQPASHQMSSELPTSTSQSFSLPPRVLRLSARRTKRCQRRQRGVRSDKRRCRGEPQRPRKRSWRRRRRKPGDRPRRQERWNCEWPRPERRRRR